MIFELAQDFLNAVPAIPPDHPKHHMLQLLEEAIRLDIHFIDRWTQSGSRQMGVQDY